MATLAERAIALPRDLAQDIRRDERHAIDAGIFEGGSTQHRAWCEARVSGAETIQRKRALDAVLACAAAGFEAPADRHALIAAVTRGADQVHSANKLSALQLAVLKRTVSRIRRGDIVVERTAAGDVLLLTPERQDAAR